MTEAELSLIVIFIISVFIGLLINHFLNKIDALNTKVDEILKTIREERR